MRLDSANGQQGYKNGFVCLLVTCAKLLQATLSLMTGFISNSMLLIAPSASFSLFAGLGSKFSVVDSCVGGAGNCLITETLKQFVWPDSRQCALFD